MPADPQSDGPRTPMGLMVIGSEMASFTLVGLLLDYVLGTMPVFTIGSTLLGFIAAFFFLVRMSRALTARKPEPPENSPEQ